MTNEELKKKICDIIAPYVSAYGDDERIADALIAAGIGDVSCLRKHRVIAEYSLVSDDDNPYIIPNVPLRVTQLYSGEEVEKMAKERDEYKHRAERAERAFSKLVHEMYEHGIRPMCDEKFFVESRLKDAEKELAEEGKND